MSKIIVDNTLANALRVLDENAPIKRLLEDVKQQQVLIRAAEGPLAELRRAGVFGPDSPLQRELERAQEVMERFETQFCLPEVCETARLMRELQKSPLAEALERYHQQTSVLRQAVERMQSPWLDVQERLQSLSGFTKLQGIGHALTKIPTFDVTFASALRVDLGDWRDRIHWPESIFEDLSKRAAFYEELGFDPALTDFPAPAFRESLDIAGVSRERPFLVSVYGPPVPPSNDEEEEVQLERTNLAHDWLLRLETQVRQFIDERMKEAYGVDWPKHRLPKDLYDKWREKKATAESAGAREWPLIAYADFTDYEGVICKRDNWREVFATYFGRPESIRESFQRLYPVRLDTMHARPITQDDELLLYVETQRLIKVILS